MTPSDWIAVQAVATIVLVLITGWYARRIKEQAEAAADAADATRKSAKATERLAELTAPEARASEADALAQIRQIAATIASDAEARQGTRTRDQLREHLRPSDVLVTRSQRRSLRRLGARVAGEVQDEVWALLDAAEDMRQTRREIRSRMDRGELRQADPGLYGQHAQEIRERLTRLGYAINRALEDLNADGDSD